MYSLWILCLMGVAAVNSVPLPQNSLVQEYQLINAGDGPSEAIEVWRVRRSPEPFPDPHHHRDRHQGYGGYGGYGGGGYNQGYGGGYQQHRPSYGGGGYGGYPGGNSFGGSSSQASSNSFSSGINSPFGSVGFSGSSAQASAGSQSGGGFYGRR